MSRHRRQATAQRRLAGGVPIPARRNVRQPRQGWCLLCEKLESRRMLAASPDRFEPNDTFETATDLGALVGELAVADLSLHSPKDYDVGRFQLQFTGSTDDRIDVIGLGYDAEVSLYDSSRRFVRFASLQEGAQRISLNGLAAGEYFVTIQGLNGIGQRAARYSLAIHAPTKPPPPLPDQDRFEPNGLYDPATNLRLVVGRQAIAGLSLHTYDESDYFTFTIAAAGTADHFIDIQAAGIPGHVFAWLSKAVVSGDDSVPFSRSVDGHGETLRLPLAGLPAGTYRLSISNNVYLDAATGGYSLLFEAPKIPPDRFEPNNSPATATDLGTVIGEKSWMGLSLHASTDQDTFLFTLSFDGATDDFLAVQLAGGAGALAVARLRDAGGNVVGVADTGSGGRIALAGMPAGTYTVEVASAEGATGLYDLAISTARERNGDAGFFPAEFTCAARPGDLVSLRVAGVLSRADFAIAVYDASNADRSRQRQVRFNDNASADTRDAGIDFVVPEGGGTYRIVVTDVANAGSRFTLTATAQDSRFEIPHGKPAFRQPIAVAASGVLRVTGNAAIGGKAQLALYNEAGDLVTTSGATGLSGSLRIDQFVLPGRYAVGIVGDATQPIPLGMSIDPAGQPNANTRVGRSRDSGWADSGVPDAIWTGDIDGDDRLDIVTTNVVNSEVSILLGNGDGTFAALQPVAVGDGPYAISVGYVDGDDRLDIVTANFLSDDVSVLLGRGDGTFAAQQKLKVGSKPLAIATADLDGDRQLDIVTANRDSHDISILLRNPDGTFAPRRTVAVGESLYAISIAHLNGDDRLDIVTNGSDDGLTILLGDRDNAFVERHTVSVGRFSWAISTAYVDGDDRLDIVTANAYSNDVSIFLGNGDGTFLARQTVAVGNFPMAISTAYVDGDNRLDIVTANSQSYDVSVLLGKGDGTFADQAAVAVGSSPKGISIAYVDGDDQLDIVTANNAILLGNGDGTFAARATIAVGSSPSAISAADLNGDGRIDVVTANEGSPLYNPGKTVSVLLGGGDGTFTTQRTFAVDVCPVAIAIADLNGDGRLDIATANQGTEFFETSGNTVSVLLGNGDGTFADQQKHMVGSAPAAIAIADLDGDRQLDIVTANRDSNDVSILLRNPDGTFGPQRKVSVGSSPIALSTAYVDGDNRLDIVTANFSSDDVSILRGNGDGTFAAWKTVPVGMQPQAVSIADLNGDNRLDIVTAHANTVSICLGNGRNGDISFAARSEMHVGNSSYSGAIPTAISLADFNGDKRPDIALTYNESSVAWILLGNGDGSFVVQPMAELADFPNSMSTADVNGDGRLDIVTANRFNDDVSILLGNGDTTFEDENAVLRQGVRMTPVGPASASIPAAQSVSVGRLNANASPDTLTLDRRGVVTARYDASATPRGFVAPAASMPAGSRGRGFDARDLPGPESTRVAVIDQSRQMLFTATPNAAGDVVDPQSVRPIGYTSTTVGDEPVAVVTQSVGGFFHRARLDFNRDQLWDVVTADRGSRTVSILHGKGDGTFEPRQSYAVPDAPTALLVADVDGDWRLDIVTASESGQSISVLRGNEDGTFQAAVRFAVDSPPSSLSAADVDFDDDLDLVFTSVAGNSVTILRGTGDGTFAAGQSVGVGRAPRAVSITDVDGRNDLDIVTANAVDGTVSILLGGAEGMFTMGQTLTVGRRPTALDTTDMNNDGRGDIVTADNEDGTVTVWMSDGNGGYGSRQTLRVAGNPTSVTVSDFDGKGRLDIAASSIGTFSILLWKEADTFASPQSFPVTFGPTSAVAVDINRDFRLDLVTINPASDSVSVMLGYGDGTFASQQPILSRFARTVVLPPPGLAPPVDALAGLADRLADLNGDGFADLVVSNINSGSIDIFPSDPDGQFLTSRGGQGSFYSSQWQRLSAGTGPSTVLLADINGDRATDLISANQVSGDVSVRLGVPGIVGTRAFQAATGFGPEFRYRTSSRVYGYDIDPFSGRGSAIVPQKLSDIALGDVNGDGLVDLVATSSQDRSFTILSGWRGDDGRWAGFGAPERHSARPPMAAGLALAGEPAEVRNVVVADFNLDGRADIALLDPVKEQILIYPGSSQARAFNAAFWGIPLMGVIPKSLQSADITGPSGIPDGILDLVVGNDFGDVLTFQGVGDGTFKAYVRADQSVALLATDIDGDGREDFIYGSKGLDRIWVAGAASQQSFEADQKKGVLGPSAVATVTETVSGRQVKNLVVANGGANQILVFRRDAAAGAAGLFLPDPQTFYVGTNPSAVFVADIDKDGLADVVVANEGSNDVSVMLGMRDGTGRWTLKAGPRLSSGGSAPAGITVSDVLGNDGIPDITVTNRGSNTAAILRGIAGGFFNDRSPTFLPISIPAPGPIVTLPGVGSRGPEIFVGSTTANQFQSFGQSGSGYTATGTYSGGGSSLATTTFGGANYLAAGNSATGGVSIFLSGPSSLSSLRFFAEANVGLPGLTSLAFDSAGRLYGVSPTTGGAIALFGFNVSGQAGADGSALNGLLQTVQAFTTRVVFTPLTVAGVGLVAALVTSEGVALADRAAEAASDGSDAGTTADGGAGEAEGEKGKAGDGKDEAESKPADAAAEDEAAGQDLEAESNPLLDFILDAKNLLRQRNRRLIESLLEREAEEPEDGDRDAVAPDAEPGAAEPGAAGPGTAEAQPPRPDPAAAADADGAPARAAVDDLASRPVDTAPRGPALRGFAVDETLSIALAVVTSEPGTAAVGVTTGRATTPRRPVRIRRAWRFLGQ